MLACGRAVLQTNPCLVHVDIDRFVTDSLACGSLTDARRRLECALTINRLQVPAVQSVLAVGIDMSDQCCLQVASIVEVNAKRSLSLSLFLSLTPLLNLVSLSYSHAYTHAHPPTPTHIHILSRYTHARLICLILE
jgi:hypothetical protein